MTAIKDAYGAIDAHHRALMNDNQEHLENMLDYAICELVNIAQENEIYLVDHAALCRTYDDVFNCLKHWSEKRKGDGK